MSESVNLPALGESVTEGTVTRWLKQVGDRVEVDEPLLEVSTDKVDTEIPSPIAGVIEEILVAEDETAEVGAPLVRIGDGSGSAGSGEAAPAEEAPAAERRSTRPLRPRRPPKLKHPPKLRHRPPRLPLPPAKATKSRSPPWARASPKAPSPAGSRALATPSRSTSRCLRSPPTRSTPRSRPRSPAPCRKSASPRTKRPRSAPSWPSSAPAPPPPPRHLPRKLRRSSSPEAAAAPKEEAPKQEAAPAEAPKQEAPKQEAPAAPAKEAAPRRSRSAGRQPGSFCGGVRLRHPAGPQARQPAGCGHLLPEPAPASAAASASRTCWQQQKPRQPRLPPLLHRQLPLLRRRVRPPISPRCAAPCRRPRGSARSLPAACASRWTSPPS